MRNPSGSHGMQLDSLHPIYSISPYCLTTITVCLAYAHHSWCSITDLLHTLLGKDDNFNTGGSASLTRYITILCMHESIMSFIQPLKLI